MGCIPRLVYFNAVDAKLRLLENVRTGKIGELTDQQMTARGYHVKHLLVRPEAACLTKTRLYFQFEHIPSTVD